MIQVKLDDGTILCAFCEDEVTVGEGFIPIKGPPRQITDAEIAKLRAANDALPEELL
jgi:hypothetical protein